MGGRLRSLACPGACITDNCVRQEGRLRTEHKQAAALGGLLLEQHQENLQDGVGEARADGHVLQQPLQVIQHYH